MGKENDIGALWLKESKSGNKFMGGVIEVNGEKINIVVFKNNYKEKENHPDYKILKSQPKEEQKPAQAAEKVFQDDIPF